MFTRTVLLVATASCNMLDPRVSDQTIDAPPSSLPDTATDAVPGSKFVLPAGTAVPPIADTPELASQIRIFDGLSDSALATAGGILVRSTGKAGGGSVRFWSFGAGRTRAR